MKQIPIKLGPLTLLLTVISICLTVLAILSFTTARADLRLAEKYADTVRSRYALEKQGQAFRQELSETDPADYGLSGWERDKDGVYHTVLTRDDLSLSIGFCPNEKGKTDILQWQHTKDWAEDESIGQLWDGGSDPYDHTRGYAESDFHGRIRRVPGCRPAGHLQMRRTSGTPAGQYHEAAGNPGDG